MSATTLPDRRALYLLNPAPTVLTPAQLDAMDRDAEGETNARA